MPRVLANATYWLRRHVEDINSNGCVDDGMLEILVSRFKAFGDACTAFHAGSEARAEALALSNGLGILLIRLQNGRFSIHSSQRADFIKMVKQIARAVAAMN